MTGDAFEGCSRCGEPCASNERCEACGLEPLNLRIGTTLAGKYRLEALLGRGGVGVVYRGTHLALGGEVAIKFLLAEWATRPEHRARFKREANALTLVHHPNIVTAMDFGEDAGALYLVMEFVRGVSLAAQLLAAKEPMSPAHIVEILDQLLQVLETAHAAGVVHRDLKPENIMLIEAPSGRSHIKVLDFGLALVDDQPSSARLTATNAAQGTPYYMSPEQCRGRDVGPPTDIYAVGAILFEMLSGETPFTSDNFAALLAQQMFLEPPAVRERGFLREPPPALEALLRSALAKRPEARPTAREFRAALHEAVDGTSALARAAKAAEERTKAGALSREERGLARDPNTAEGAPSTSTPLAAPRVAFWGFQSSRLESLRSILGTNGITAVAWSQDTPPPAILDGHPIAVVVLSHDATAAKRTELARASSDLGALPILVTDLANAQEMSVLIRAGASDVTLAGSGDDVIFKRISRLIRRKR